LESLAREGLLKRYVAYIKSGHKDNFRALTHIMIAPAVSAAYRPALMITPEQIRAGRALLGWKQSDLAKASGVSEISVKNIERGATDPRASTLAALERAFTGAGLLFLDPGVNRDGGAGVRFR